MIEAPGWPGIEPRWTSGSKVGVGTAISKNSHVWFTVSHGIVNEVYFPRLDIANIRDLGFIVTDGHHFFSEERKDCKHIYKEIVDGVPALQITNICISNRYKIEKIVIADPERDVLLQKIQFTPLVKELADYRMYVLLAPHIANSGWQNTGWTGKFKGMPMLFAKRNPIALACAASEPFIAMSCGFVGVSDGWQDLHKNKQLTACYTKATDGNIALCGEIDLKACQGCFVLALGFASLAEDAGLQVHAALLSDFDKIYSEYKKGWHKVQDQFINLAKADQLGGSLFRVSAAVLKIHESKHHLGSVIASLSIPWGFSKSKHDFNCYHLIRPREQVLAGLALLAAGDRLSAKDVLLNLMCTQEPDGHWMQCFSADGQAVRNGLQMDQTALPILLADYLRRANCLQGSKSPWPMVQKAAAFIVKNGPETDQDRWEENSGYTPFTIAVEIAALLAAADFFILQGLHAEAVYLQELADWWNDCIEGWLYVKHTPLAKRMQVEGYYARIAPVGFEQAKTLVIKNRPWDISHFPYTDIVSVDALSLVLYGLRDPEDSFMTNTVKVIDGLLKTETAKGPVWHRYNEDGYGEHKDGSPFDGTGTGRGWPVLVGERAHYELAKGNKQEAVKLLRIFAGMAGVGGLFPEQIWDAADNPTHRLYNGHSSGSVKPLVWAHAEYITLLRSLQDRQVFHCPPQTYERYRLKKIKATKAIWTKKAGFKTIKQGLALRIQLLEPASIRWTTDGWHSFQDMSTIPTSLGVHFADLPTNQLKSGSTVLFTMFYPELSTWEGSNYALSFEG